MIERGGHWGRHYMAPLAGPIHTDVWQRLELLVRRAGAECVRGREAFGRVSESGSAA